MTYEISFKEEIIRRVFCKEEPETITRISQETGVNKRTIHRWIRVFEKINGAVHHLKIDSKIRTFLDTLNLDFESKSKYCRTHGLYIEELWDC